MALINQDSQVVYVEIKWGERFKESSASQAEDSNSQRKGFHAKYDILYSVRGLERIELGGSHGSPERLWDRFL